MLVAGKKVAKKNFARFVLEYTMFARSKHLTFSLINIFGLWTTFKL